MDTATPAEAVSQDVKAIDKPLRKQISVEKLNKDNAADKVLDKDNADRENADGQKADGDKSGDALTSPNNDEPNGISSSASSSGSSERHFSPPVQVGSHTTTATSFSSERRKNARTPSPTDGAHDASATPESRSQLVRDYLATLAKREPVRLDCLVQAKMLNELRRGVIGTRIRIPKRGTKPKFPRRIAVSTPTPTTPSPPAQIKKRVRFQQQEEEEDGFINVPADIEPDLTSIWPRKFKPIPQPGNFRLRDTQGFHSVKYITGGAWRKAFYKRQEDIIEAKDKGYPRPLGPPETDDNMYFDFPSGLGFHFARNIDTDSKRHPPCRRAIYANDFGPGYDQNEEYKLTSVEQWQRAHPIQSFLPLDPELGRVSMPIRFRLTEEENPYEKAPLLLNRQQMSLNDGDYTFI